MEPEISYTVSDPLITGVIATAVWSEPRRPGLWQDMLRALGQGASGAKGGTAGSFLFQAMVDRLLEEYRTLEAEKQELSK